jgi:hypothetical protein
MLFKSMRFILAIMVVLLGVMVNATLAHEEEADEDSGLVFVFGWRNEPALAGQINGPELFIYTVADEHEDDHEDDNDHEDADDDHEHESARVPVTDADLQVEVTFGPQSITLPLRPAFGDPGHYIADVIPTLPGDYAFHITGTAGEWEIDQTFNSADGGFSSVEPVADVQFPEVEPSIFDLLERIEALEAAVGVGE